MPSAIIQWFPGHMAKTRRLISENISSVDIVIEILDARIPISSKNPEIAKLCEKKPILTVFNKASLSDPQVNGEWKEYYKKEGASALFIDCKTGMGIDRIEKEIKEILKEKIEHYLEKGMEGKKVKAMIVGIPNVGKSTLINRLSSSSKAKAEDRPGVTKTKQWVSTSIGIDLLDMPGVLWPKFEDQTVGQNLAATGAIKDDVLELEDVAFRLVQFLKMQYPSLLTERYKLNREISDMEDYDLFEEIGRKRGFLMSGGVINDERTANMLLDEFRQAKIGQISLERPSTAEKENVQ